VAVQGRSQRGRDELKHIRTRREIIDISKVTTAFIMKFTNRFPILRISLASVSVKDGLVTSLLSKEILFAKSSVENTAD
jgi:hypothetical protein